MCGIAGVVGMPDPDAVRAMIAAQRHRGPNDHGTFADDFLALGMCRLSILDVSDAGHQPMSNVNQSIWIVYNGELYNFKDERRLLEARGHRFNSHTDTEVVLHMYEEYGDDFLLRMRGMFALAIYDLRQGPDRRKLLLARDQLGIKPLLYARTSFGFVFASEMKAISASGRIAPTIDPDGLRKLLTYGSVYQPSTLIEGVTMLPPAHRLIFTGGELRQDRYWSMALDRRPDVRKMPYEGQVEAVAATLQESLRLHLVSDVPVGAFLSGGVDSNYLVALMAREIGRQVKTFSVGYEDVDASLDETQEAESSARRLGTEHTRVTVRGQDLRDAIDAIALGLDQPTVDGVNSYFVSRAAVQQVTVAISGTGGDELFAGYPWFRVMDLFEKQFQQRPLKNAMVQILRRLAGRPPRANFLQTYFSCYHLFPPEEARRLLAPGLRPVRNDSASMLADLLPTDELPNATAIERVSALCLRGYTNNQLLRDVDAVSMAHSLEVRVPFLDVPLLDLALSLPAHTKMGNVVNVEAAYRGSYRETGGKRILIDAGRMAGLLPRDIDLQPKRGFSMPFDRWLKGPLRDVVEDCLSSRSVRMRGLLDPGMACSIREEFYRGQRPWNQVWTLMLLEVWCRAVIDRAAQPLRRAA